jgi:hypothetical protein
MSQKLQQRKLRRSEKTAVIINNKYDTEKIFEVFAFDTKEGAKSFFQKTALKEFNFLEDDVMWKAVVDALKDFNYFGYGSCTSPTSKITLMITEAKALDDDKELT